MIDVSQPLPDEGPPEHPVILFFRNRERAAGIVVRNQVILNRARYKWCCDRILEALDEMDRHLACALELQELYSGDAADLAIADHKLEAQHLRRRVGFLCSAAEVVAPLCSAS